MSKCTRALIFETILLQDMGATQTQMERPTLDKPHLMFVGHFMFVGDFAQTQMERPARIKPHSFNPHLYGRGGEDSKQGTK